jgi:hypothetical protein
MEETLLLLGITLLAPGQCVLLHAGQTRGSPLAPSWPASRRKAARLAGLISLGFAMLLLSSRGLALALVLPLAALSTAGLLYVAAVHVWRQTTLGLSALSSVIGLVLLIIGGMVTP